MATDKEMIKTLFKIASRQQKIIEKLAQQVAGTPATLEDFNALLQQIMSNSNSGKSSKETTAKIESSGQYPDGTYALKMSGSIDALDFNEFKKQAIAKWCNGDAKKFQISRIIL